MNSKNICKFVMDEDINRLKISNFVYESDYDIISHPRIEENNRGILVKKGTGMFYADNTGYPYETGSLIFSFQRENVYFEPQGDCEYIYVSFHGERANTLFMRFNITSSNRVFDGFDGLIPMWAESVSSASKNNIDLAAESVLLYAFSRLNTSSDDKNHIVDTVTDITQKEFSDCDLSLEKIAEKLNYNPKYLSHTFKVRMNVTYSEYLRNLRIKYAVTLFDHGLDSVKNVAYLSGFKDPLYFSSVFKKVVGVSPKEYTEKNNI